MTARTLWRWILAVSLGPTAALGAHGCAQVAGISAPVPASCTSLGKDGGAPLIQCGGDCGVCNGGGCTADADCASGICYLTKCAPPTNADACPPSVQGDRCQACHSCALDVACVVDGDCASGLCMGQQCVKCDTVGNLCPGKHCAASTGSCLATTCANGVIDGDETGVDCGGSCETELGKACALSCDTGGQCGLGCGMLCDLGEPCQSAADCLSKYCMPGDSGSPGTCQLADACMDGVKDDGETDLDCGGPHCVGCRAGRVCGAGTDCLSGTCAGGHCTALPSCSDMKMNGDETDVDCGGPCLPCADTKGCVSGGDCVSDACEDFVCVSCTDHVQNQDETDVDCGGSCPKCGDKLGCAGDGDCTSGACDSSVCVSCKDGVQNQDETDVDCGGSCPKCAGGLMCLVSGDCASDVCLIGRCAAPTCTDGARNGAETDTDCGGPLCPGCGPQKMCLVGSDCLSNMCTMNKCN